MGPGRRPFHTIIPGFVTRTAPDGGQEPWLTYGIVGGDQQPQAHIQILFNILLFDMDVQQALDAPRFRHWSENRVSFESAIPSPVIDDLRSRGHAPQNLLMETAQTFFLGYVSGSDSRRDGLAAAH